MCLVSRAGGGWIRAPSATATGAHSPLPAAIRASTLMPEVRQNIDLSLQLNFNFSNIHRAHNTSRMKITVFIV